MKKKYVFLLVFFGVVILFGIGTTALASSDHRANLSPTLRLLLERNQQELAASGKPLDLAPYATRLEVYSGEKRIGIRKRDLKSEAGISGFSFEVAEESSGHELGLLVETSSPASLRANGFRVGTVAGEIVTAIAPISRLKELALIPTVEYVQASRRLTPGLNKSIPAIGANKLHGTSPVLRGEGVIAGIVDSGIDYDRKDYRVEKVPGDGIDEETSRIKYLWDQVGNDGNGGPGPPPPDFGYGTEYTGSEIEEDIANGSGAYSGLVRESDPLGHGTHVAGIVSGDGSSNPNPEVFSTYRGVAPGADIVAVKTTMTTSDIIDGVNYIFTKADQAGKPAVVNLSLGGHYGPHDGTGLFSRALDELTGPGRIIVAAAGNEGSEFIHAGDTVLSGGSSTVYFEIADLQERLKDAAAITTWYSGESSLTVTVTSPNGHSLSAKSGFTASVVTPDGAIVIDNASAGKYEENGDKELEINLAGQSFGSSDNLAPGTWQMTLSAPSGTSSGRFDSWYYYRYDGESFGTVTGNNRMSIGVPGVAEKVITVGAEITKTSWIGADGGEHDYLTVSDSDTGNIATFSSWGPTRDGRLKPEITAPGFGIASTLSAGYASELMASGNYDMLVTRDERHVMMAGTSMSAPHVSGQVALMLQENPNLTPGEVEERLTGTADSDRYTSVGYDPVGGSFSRAVGAVANNTWGYGKLDSDQSARTIGFSLEETEKLSVKLGPNPATSEDNVHVYYQLPDGASDPTFHVYNAAGREVYSSDLPPTEEVFQWSLRGNRGKALANGVYLYLVRADGRTTEVGQLMVERS